MSRSLTRRLLDDRGQPTLPTELRSSALQTSDRSTKRSLAYRCNPKGAGETNDAIEDVIGIVIMNRKR